MSLFAEIAADPLGERLRKLRKRLLAQAITAPQTVLCSVPCQKKKLSISVIVLNLNGENLLASCLDHLLKQTVQPQEIIVVDNASSDRSAEVVASFNNPLIRWTPAPCNMGVAGGRNFGFTFASGEVIAFIDNDGYADPLWLEQGVRALYSAPDIGGVASVVFLKKNCLVLNGIGGGSSKSGRTGDLFYCMPLEDVVANRTTTFPPHEVLYPMGCGMLIRRTVMDQVLPLDSALLKWFDDVELGVRIWRLGLRVIVASQAIVDHDFNTSDKEISRSNWRRSLLFERARIRHMIKYQEPKYFVDWALGDLATLYSSLARGCPQHLAIYFLAWLWNIANLATATEIRRAWRGHITTSRAGIRAPLVTCGNLQPCSTDNFSFAPSFAALSESLVLDGLNDSGNLHYGWHNAESFNGQVGRRASAQASVFLLSRNTTYGLELCFCYDTRRQLPCPPVTIALRNAGELENLFTTPLENGSSGWRAQEYALPLAPGIYELVFLSAPSAEGTLVVSSIALKGTL